MLNTKGVKKPFSIPSLVVSAYFFLAVFVRPLPFRSGAFLCSEDLFAPHPFRSGAFFMGPKLFSAGRGPGSVHKNITGIRTFAVLSTLQSALNLL